MRFLRRLVVVHMLASLQARLLLIVLLALIPAFGLAIYNSDAQRQLATEAARQQTKRLARQAQSDQLELIAAAHQLLFALESLPALHAQGPLRCDELLTAVKTHSFYANLGVINRAGFVSCSATSLTAPFRVTERPYFQFLLQSRHSSIGEFELGWLGTRPTVNIGVPLVDEFDETQGVVFATLDTAWFATFAQMKQLPTGSTLLVAIHGDTLLTRVRADEVWVQYTPADQHLQTLTRAGLTADIQDPDDVTRLYSLVRTKAGSAEDAYIGLGIPVSAAYAQADQLLWQSLLVLTVVGLVASAAAWSFGDVFVVRPVRRLIRATEHLRAGDLSARVEGPARTGEITKLARAFDELAEALQSRDRERARAEAAEREQRALAESLRDIASAFNSTLDFDQVLDRILDHVGRVVPYDTANIMLFEGGAARVVRGRGYDRFGDDEWIFAQRFDLARFPNMNYAASPDGPVDLISDVRQYADWVDLPESRWIRSHLAAPIRTKGFALGILNLDSATPGFFNADHASALQTFADQAAIALENARLLRESRARADQFAALYATASDLAAPQRDLAFLLQTIIERAVALLNCPGGTAYLYNVTRDELELVSQKGLFFSPNFRIKLGTGLVGKVAATRQPLIVDDYQKWYARLPHPDTLSLRAVLGVPMLYGGELIGVLTVVELGASSRRFTEADMHLLALFAGLAASVVRNTRLFQETRTRAEQLALVYDAGLALNSVLQPKAQLEFLFNITMQALHADRAEFLRYERTSDSLRVEMAIGFSEQTQRDLSKLNLPLSSPQGVTAWVGRSRLPLYLPNVHVEPRWIRVDPEVSAGLWVPVETDHHLLGVLAVLSTHTDAFTPEDERLLVLFANQVAVAMENARLFQDSENSRRELERAYDATLEGWSRALDLRDEETKGHTQRVTDLTVRLARAMKLSEEQIEHIRRGALLHDIGKMAIPDRILFKPGPLTNDEWLIMQRHPSYANKFISPIAYLRPSLDIPYCHHERWDGKGYPRGLKGEDIPLAARIFAVVDVWDALLSQRPYREPWSVEQVLSHIASLSGTHLDPHVVHLFLDIMRKEDVHGSHE
ncbi:MAG: GAF domain-containing protein [Chloroflexi bacterium]|nr:GAF domain-containing protein [Chloroflexota bacterium]